MGVSGFEVRLKKYINDARQFSIEQKKRRAPSGKIGEATQRHRNRGIDHADRVVQEGEALLGWIERASDIWIVAQLAFEFGKLHEHWKVAELARRIRNHRKAAESTNNGALRKSDNRQAHIRRRAEALARAGTPKRKIAGEIAEEIKVSARHVRRLLAKQKNADLTQS